MARQTFGIHFQRAEGTFFHTAVAARAAGQFKLRAVAVTAAGVRREALRDGPHVPQEGQHSALRVFRATFQGLRFAVMPLPLRWNDLGSWEAFYEISPHDEDGNARQGDVMLEDCRNCYLHSTGRLLAAVGVEDLAVVETRDAVLVARRDRVQDVKRIVQRLEKENRPEHALHPRVCRPWGSYERLAEGERFQVKRIVVEPGGELSLQKHYHRAEHWVVVGGVAEVTLGEEVRLVTENESIYIPQGSLHRLKNPGKLPLLLIEIQTGSYLGEDDIVRVSDVYGRTDPPSAPSADHKEAQ